MNRKLYQHIASWCQAMANCKASGNSEWFDRHMESIEHATNEWLPSGSGFDCGTKFDFERSSTNRLVFTTSFHHMDDGGSYDGWTEHDVIVKPDLASGYDLRITGRDRNDIKDYIAESFSNALDREFDPAELVAA